VKEGVKSSARSLYTAYKEWAQETNEWAMRERQFSTALKERGFKNERHSAGMVWKGISVIHTDRDLPTGNY
jgi:hypothetical protein